MELAFALVISWLSIYVPVKAASLSRNADPPNPWLNASESLRGDQCGGVDYYDIRTERRLYFSACKESRRRKVSIGDNRQLQCQPSLECAGSAGLREAVCYNIHDEDSDPDWQCEGLFSKGYRFYRADVNCEVYPEAGDHCVLRDSCILIYVSMKTVSRFLIFTIMTSIVLMLFCLITAVYSVRRIRAEPRYPASASGRTDEEQNNYDPATDVPPSYNTVERNPKRFSKPDIMVPSLRSRSETPPPSYEMCSDEEACKF